jgi:hypothetical protein
VELNDELARPVEQQGAKTSNAQLAREAEWWARQKNIEAIWCWLPTFEQVCDDVHVVTALGNDAMAVNVLVDNHIATLATGRGGEEAQLAYLGRFMAQVRAEEGASLKRSRE